MNNIPMRQVITSFAGLRAHEDHHEFIIKELPDCKGFIDCAGIESPGLSSSPAIGKMVADILKEKAELMRRTISLPRERASWIRNPCPRRRDPG